MVFGVFSKVVMSVEDEEDKGRRIKLQNSPSRTPHRISKFSECLQIGFKLGKRKKKQMCCTMLWWAKRNEKHSI